MYSLTRSHNYNTIFEYVTLSFYTTMLFANEYKTEDFSIIKNANDTNQREDYSIRKSP